MKLLPIACLFAMFGNAWAQTGTVTTKPPVAPLQSDAARLDDLAKQIQSDLKSMKRFELSVKTLKKISEAESNIKRMRAAAPAPASTPR